jgi:hypothetical protein
VGELTSVTFNPLKNCEDVHMASPTKSKPKTIKQRIEELETQVAELRKRLPPEEPGWKKVVGIFGPEDTEAFDEAMRLGREYRESLRPKQATSRKRSNGRARH